MPQYQEAIRLDPTHAEPHYLLGRTYAKLNRMDDSRRELDRAQKVQAEKGVEEETLVNASGNHGDPARGLGLIAEPLSQEKPQP